MLSFFCLPVGICMFFSSVCSVSGFPLPVKNLHLFSIADENGPALRPDRPVIHYKLLFVSESIVSQLPKLGGQFYSRWGKFPFVIKTNEQVKNKVDEQLASVKFQLKKVLCLAVAVANVDMTEEQIKQNLDLTINFLVSLLKKGWNNIKSLYIKTTMGKPVSLF